MVCRPVDIHQTNRVTFHFQGFPISRVKKVLISYIDAKKTLVLQNPSRRYEQRLNTRHDRATSTDNRQEHFSLQTHVPFKACLRES